jgi:phosphoglycolate phosphatase-like HAD superfamily hydrolase
VSVAVLLWDFGDTLVDERWMLRVPENCPNWVSAWTHVMRSHADDWNTGRLGEAEVFAAVFERTDMTVEEVEAHVDVCCRAIAYHPVAWRVAAERRLPQALVTVNPDSFISRIVGSHGLEAMFDVIVVSSAEGTTDKVRLCEVALRRLGFDGDRRDALLIDNRKDLIDAWCSSGGAGYWYQGDEAFEADLAELLG